MNCVFEMMCEICYTMVLDGEEYAIVHANSQLGQRDYHSCMLCAASAERLGWGITV